MTSIAAWATIAAAERAAPHHPEWNLPDDDAAADRWSFLTGIAVAAAGQWIGERASRHVRRRLPLDRLPAPLGVAAAVLAADLVHTLHHLLNHRWAPAWRIHAVHHQARRLYWMNASRSHLLERFDEVALQAALAALLRMTPAQRTAVQVLRTTYGQLQHANLDLDCGRLDLVFSTPELHRLHHSIDVREGNANFGAIVTVWDRLLGTHSRPDEPFDGPIGVDGDEGPRSWWAVQWAPFRAGSDGEAAASRPGDRSSPSRPAA